ncbi:MAG TPA: family 1 glycosylhydrolase [Terriglobales bacterium]|nr:family 1 glycosylhydrolase [Terriglobales bacterium]
MTFLPPSIAQERPATLTFPPGFLWGVSTAAYQVEGGHSDSQWHAWEAAGRIKSGDRRGLACNWWQDEEPDFDLARGLGLNALRLSVEWSRLEPRKGEWNGQAAERYRAMLSALRQRGIQPFVCLHHFSHPLWLEQKGGFLCPQAEELFERFARRMVEALGDLCQDWVTFNEPNVYAALGYVLGEFPPGRKGELLNAIRVMSSMGRAHARAYRAIHRAQPRARVGWAHNYVVFEPARPGGKLDRVVASLAGELFNNSFLRVVEEGRLAFPLSLADGNLAQARGTCDFVGLNVYSRFHVAFDAGYGSQLFGRLFVPPDAPQGDHGVDNPYGEAYPQALRSAVERASRLKKPVYILENGVPDARDCIRPWLIVNAVKELHGLINEGRDIRGYFHWTLTDNFEWSEGWKLRFGLYALDPQTQQRTARGSAELYKSIVRQSALTPDLLERYGTLASPASEPAKY